MSANRQLRTDFEFLGRQRGESERAGAGQSRGRRVKTAVSSTGRCR